MSDIRKKIAVIGGGASGLICAYFSCLNGNDVTLFEKNEKLGKKIYITGKGRCNLSNFCSVEEYLNNVVNNPKFMYSAINNFSPKDTYDFFENLGLKLKIERGNRVFPESDKASDVTKTLENAIRKLGVNIILNTLVEKINVKDNTVIGLTANSVDYFFDKIVICTGGASYPLTGSTGDGYNFASSFGHEIVKIKPSLVGIELKGNDFCDLQGISLKNVKLSVFNSQKLVYEDFGEMLFTHFGISGPIVLSASSKINTYNPRDIVFSIDLKPALSMEVLNDRILRELSNNKTKSVFNAVRSLLPKDLVNLVLLRANVLNSKICSNVTKEERFSLCKTLKNLNFNMKSFRPIDEAIVTSGGVSVKEVNPKTMESKLIKGLFFAGEVLDIDCFTGGFNLQTAFSTGTLAGQNT